MIGLLAISDGWEQGERMLISTRSLLVIVVAFIGWQAANSQAATAAPATQPALKMTVSPTRQITLSLGSKVLASGYWGLFDATWHAIDVDQFPLGSPPHSSVVQDSPTHAVIVDSYPNAEATIDIKLDGEDLRFAVHAKNMHPQLSLKNIAVGGLTFHFSRNASGTIASWHGSYLSAHGTTIFHPSLLQPLGEVFAHDDQFGFGAYSSSEFDRQSLFNTNFKKDGIIPAECLVVFYTLRSVPAGGSVDVDTTFRISTDFSMPHLLEGYKKIYKAHFPAPLYHPDARPVAQFAAIDQSFITPANPLGYNGPTRRLDSPAGTAAYVRLIAPALEQAGALGIIFWSPGGVDPPMYPPDFDQFPKSVQRNIPSLVDGFARHHLRVGLCARCGDGVTREPGKEPQMYRLDVKNPAHMKTLMDRFDHAMQMGFDLFYLDSFGIDNPNDQEILKLIRDKVGPDVQLYTEFCTDMSLPYAGHYCEWREGGILWTSLDRYTTLRSLCPDSPWLCISRTDQKVPAEFAKLGLTPLVEDLYSNRLPTTRPLP